VKSLNGPIRAEPVTILYCLILGSPNLEGQVPIMLSPRNRVAQLHPRHHQISEAFDMRMNKFTLCDIGVSTVVTVQIIRDREELENPTQPCEA
jgi:hypothetical protein